jgi:hypothetical protein
VICRGIWSGCGWTYWVNLDEEGTLKSWLLYCMKQVCINSCSWWYSPICSTGCVFPKHVNWWNPNCTSLVSCFVHVFASYPFHEWVVWMVQGGLKSTHIFLVPKQILACQLDPRCCVLQIMFVKHKPNFQWTFGHNNVPLSIYPD